MVCGCVVNIDEKSSNYVKKTNSEYAEELQICKKLPHIFVPGDVEHFSEKTHNILMVYSL